MRQQKMEGDRMSGRKDRKMFNSAKKKNLRDAAASENSSQTQQGGLAFMSSQHYNLSPRGCFSSTVLVPH